MILRSSQYVLSVRMILLFTGAAAAFGFGFLNVEWKTYGEVLLGVGTLMQGLLTFWSAQTSEMVHAYLAYILFGVLYTVMITMAS